MKKSLKTHKLYYPNKLSKKNKKTTKNFRTLYYGGKPDISNEKYIDTTKDFWEQKTKEGLEYEWYQKALDKWAKKPASVSGVLDGFVSASEPDLKESGIFLDILAQIYNKNTNKNLIKNNEDLRVLDCGAGIGRISSGILMQRFHYVDLVEPVAHFIDKAKIILSKHGHQGNFYQVGLQDFNTDVKYDCIWIQWVLGQISDNDVIIFLKRCKMMLKPNGIIVVKENMLTDGFSIDENYNLINRSYNDTKKLFDFAGLRIIYEENQKDFPSYLTKVHMFALE